MPSEVKSADLETLEEQDFEETINNVCRVNKIQYSNDTIFQIECDADQQQTARLKVIKSLETSPASASIQEIKHCHDEIEEDSEDPEFCEDPEDREDPEDVTNDAPEYHEEEPTLDIDPINQIESFQEEVTHEAVVTEEIKVLEKTDGLTRIPDCPLVREQFQAEKTIQKTEEPPADGSEEERGWSDSETDSETSESEEEFMADGERVRKTSRGFKQISNCKRFWRASLLTGQTGR